MTTVSSHSSLVDANAIVRGELLDAVVEVVVHARGPAARAAIIAELVEEMYATVAWLHDNETGLDDFQADELTSITRLIRAARDHRLQMNASREMASTATANEVAPPLRTAGRPTSAT